MVSSVKGVFIRREVLDLKHRTNDESELGTFRTPAGLGCGTGLWEWFGCAWHV